MKQKYFFYLVFILIIAFFLQNKNKITKRNIHENLIDNHPIQQTLSLSKNERKSNNLPPNKYYDQEYLLELNPETGKTYPEKLIKLQEDLSLNRSVPGSTDFPWVERGPNDVPGRTRAMIYDSNDPTHKRVFAGGVTGGLWVNDNIESSTSAWQRIAISENLVVSSITYDINDSDIMYVGTGEPYVGSEGTGNGIWKSTDRGVTWNHIFGGSSGETTFISDALVTINNSTVSGDYAAMKSSQFGPEIPSIGVTGDLVLSDDGSANPTEGCNTFTVDYTDKIVVIDRGTCYFTEKVKNAQDANAIGVIIIQSLPDFPFGMGGTDDTITIPSVMISKIDGDLIKNEMLTTTISATLNPVETTLPTGIRLIPGKFHVNDIVTRNNNGTTEIYAAITESRYMSYSYVLGGEFGIYKSVDGGDTWTLLDLPLTTDGNPHPINDLLITSDNYIWAGSINSASYRKADDTLDGGGKIFVSTDGVTFTQKYENTDGNRVELAASATNPNKIYALIYTNNSVLNIIKTTDGFNTTSILPKPNDLGSNDFTNGQGWYDLAITVDPTDDAKIYIGGVNTFKSTNSGSNWVKTSRYYYSGNSSIVHPDIHSIVLDPLDPNKGLIGCDGGVYYVDNWSNAENSSVIYSRGIGYNTTQFYKGAIGQSITNNQFLGGTQDNGTHLINNGTEGINSSYEIGGGDGMYCFIDKDGEYLIYSLYYNSYYLVNMTTGSSITLGNDQGQGSFVNVAELDDNLDILYSNSHVLSGTTMNAAISRYKNITSSPIKEYLINAMLTRPVTALKVSPYTTDNTLLFVGTDSGSLYKIENANSTPIWTDLTPEPFITSFSGSISSINFGASNDEIMVTFHNYGVTNIYFSEDGGITWENKEGDLPDLPVKDILMNPLNNNEVIIATDLGVWSTANFKDENPNWIQSHNGMQNVKVTSFDLRTADNTVLASTYGRGFFTSRFAYPLGVSDIENINNSFMVYPTISNGKFNIKANNIGNDININIVDINGKEVYNSTLDYNNEPLTISLKSHKGVYFVYLNANGIKEIKKIIIK